MPASVDIREGVAEAFDALRDEFFENAGNITLVKPSSTANEFEDIETVSSKWFLEYSEYRQNFLLQIADDDGFITTAMETATHVQIDGETYIIRKADTIPPKGTDPTWKIFCDRFPERGQFIDLY